MSRSQVFSVLNGVRGRRASEAADAPQSIAVYASALPRPRRRSLIGAHRWKEAKRASGKFGWTRHCFNALLACRGSRLANEKLWCFQDC